jgi:hypothetical protein
MCLWIALPTTHANIWKANIAFIALPVRAQESFPTLHQIALDTLIIPVISTECERVFSSTKKLINPMRSLLKTDIIEACECLKAGWDCGMVGQ